MDCSIIVPVYNKKNRISETLDSLLLQDYPGSYEIIVVDDGSTDKSIEQIEDKSEKIKIVRQDNKGAAVARYIGVLNSKAPIVVFQDADDIASPDKIRLLVKGLEKHPEAVASFANTVVLNGKPLPTLQNEVSVSPSECALIRNPTMLILSRFLPLALAMNLAGRREYIVKASADRGFYKAANDFDLQLRLSEFGPFAYVNATTNHYYRGRG